MKKFTYVLALAMLASTFTYAQEYKKFKVGLGLGYAMASGSGSSGGVLFTLEPAYRSLPVIPWLSVHLAHAS